MAKSKKDIIKDRVEKDREGMRLRNTAQWENNNRMIGRKKRYRQELFGEVCELIENEHNVPMYDGTFFMLDSLRQETVSVNTAILYKMYVRETIAKVVEEVEETADPTDGSYERSLVVGKTEINLLTPDQFNRIVIQAEKNVPMYDLSI